MHLKCTKKGNRWGAEESARGLISNALRSGLCGFGWRNLSPRKGKFICDKQEMMRDNLTGKGVKIPGGALGKLVGVFDVRWPEKIPFENFQIRVYLNPYDASPKPFVAFSNLDTSLTGAGSGTTVDEAMHDCLRYFILDYEYTREKLNRELKRSDFDWTDTEIF